MAAPNGPAVNETTAVDQVRRLFNPRSIALSFTRS